MELEIIMMLVKNGCDVTEVSTADLDYDATICFSKNHINYYVTITPYLDEPRLWLFKRGSDGVHHSMGQLSYAEDLLMLVKAL